MRRRLTATLVLALLVLLSSEATASARTPRVVCWSPSGQYWTWKVHPRNCKIRVRHPDYGARKGRFFDLHKIHWNRWRTATGHGPGGVGISALGKGRLWTGRGSDPVDIQLWVPRRGWRNRIYYSKVFITSRDGFPFDHRARFLTDVPHHRTIYY